MPILDVTDKVEFGLNDDESLPITQCVCGKVFIPWEFHIGIYDDSPYACPKCGRRFFFRVDIMVYEVTD